MLYVFSLYDIVDKINKILEGFLYDITISLYRYT